MKTFPCEECILKVMCINKPAEAIMCCSIVLNLIVEEVSELTGNEIGDFSYYLSALDKQLSFYINQNDMYIHRDSGLGYNWVARKG